MGKNLQLKFNLVFAVATLTLIIVSGSKFREATGTSDLASALEKVAILIVAIALLYRAHRQQRRSEDEKQKFVSLVQNSGDLIAIASFDRKLEYLNPAGRAILGLGPDEYADGKSTPEFYAAADDERMRTLVIPTVKERGYWSGELNYRHTKTAELIPVQMNVFPLKNHETGKTLGIAAVSRDIRDRKILEKKLDRFFDVSLDMLAIANTKGYFVRLNPAFTDVLGWTEAELCSRPCTEFIHPDDIQSTIEQIERQAGGGTVLSFENRYRTRNGDYRWFSWKSSPDGDLTYGAARDITEEKEKNALLLKLNVEAVQASQAKSDFLANMSHEIRTPINGVVGMTTLLLDSHLSVEQLEYAQSIKSSAESLLTVINDILDFSKVEAGKLDIENVDFNLETLIDETAKSMSWAVAHKSIPLIVRGPKDLKHMFRGDPGRIRQVLTNLLGNAIKFTNTGSIRLNVEAANVTETKTTYRFAIVDTGIGLSNAAQKKIFLPFAQADASTSRRYGGTGLGLSICKNLVTLMGGEIGVDSHEGEGATFWFTLDFEHSTSLSNGIARGVQGIEPSKFPGAQILIAEDNVINQKILLSMLAKLGFKAQAVANGSEALSLLRERPFDMVLMDCQMPEMDGYEATRQIRASKSIEAANLPIVAMTANALKGDKEKCLASGMNDYATKPINIENLSVLIEKWLEFGSTTMKKKTG